MDLVAALLLGVVLAPTDAVLASDIHVPAEIDQDAVPFTLAAEGALTSALAAPLLLIVLEFLGFDDSGSGALGAHLLLSAWSIVGGAVVGWLVGALMMRWLALLDSDRQGDFLEDMIVVATAVLTYVGALALRTDGLIAVFVAGLALSHGGRLRHSLRKPTPSARVLRFAGRIERFAAVLVMVLIGALLDGRRAAPAHGGVCASVACRPAAAGRAGGTGRSGAPGGPTAAAGMVRRPGSGFALLPRIGH